MWQSCQAARPSFAPTRIFQLSRGGFSNLLDGCFGRRREFFFLRGVLRYSRRASVSLMRHLEPPNGRLMASQHGLFGPDEILLRACALFRAFRPRIGVSEAWLFEAVAAVICHPRATRKILFRISQLNRIGRAFCLFRETSKFGGQGIHCLNSGMGTNSRSLSSCRVLYVVMANFRLTSCRNSLARLGSWNFLQWALSLTVNFPPLLDSPRSLYQPTSRSFSTPF